MKIDSSGKPIASSIGRIADDKASARLKALGSTDSSTSTQSVASEGVTTAGEPFDADKVASIRQAIAEGRFAVRPEAIADKLLVSVKELLAE